MRIGEVLVVRDIGQMFLGFEFDFCKGRLGGFSLFVLIIKEIISGF